MYENNILTSSQCAHYGTYPYKDSFGKILTPHNIESSEHAGHQCARAYQYALRRAADAVLRLECGHKPENMVTQVIPKEQDQKCPYFGELFRLEGTLANTGIALFRQFRSKSKLGYFCCRPFPEFRAFLDRCKTDPRGVILYKEDAASKELIN